MAELHMFIYTLRNETYFGNPCFYDPVIKKEKKKQKKKLCLIPCSHRYLFPEML